MPYNPNSRQAVAVFLSIKRDKGLAAAKAWGRKHRGELAAEMKHNQNAKGKKRRGKGYVPRGKQAAHPNPFAKGAPPTGRPNPFAKFQKGAKP